MPSMTELWAKGNAFRTLTVHGSPKNPRATVHLTWGAFEGPEPVERAVGLYGLHETILISGGYGTERWYHDIPTPEAVERIKGFRDRAKKAGYTELGKTSI
ncbi:MAG: hypothetical protein Q8R28_14965 [Dehalococcoidia bacterium]|nr:hypothetical protein [Dehalococcoidia bacterium]